MITVYTCITNNKDYLLDVKPTAGVKYVAFVDGQIEGEHHWEIKPTYNLFTSPRRNSRIQKILAHQFIDTEYSIYLDASLRLIANPHNLVGQYLTDYDLAMPKHPNRNCLYQEGVECINRGLDDREVIENQMADYYSRGFPKEMGLAAGGMIIRRHTPEVKRFNEIWWSEYCRHSVRDQIALPVALHESGVDLNVIEAPLHLEPDGLYWGTLFKQFNHLKYE